MRFRPQASPRTGPRGRPISAGCSFAAGPPEAAVADRMLELAVPADKQAMVGYGTYAKGVDVLEQAVTAKPFIAGDRFSAADVWVGSHIGWGLQFGTIEKRSPPFPTIGRVSATARRTSAQPPSTTRPRRQKRADRPPALHLRLKFLSETVRSAGAEQPKRLSQFAPCRRPPRSPRGARRRFREAG